MKKISFFFILLTISIHCITQEASSNYISELNSTTFKEKVWDYNSSKSFKSHAKLPIILEFYATWCSPCKRLAPNLQAIQDKYSSKIKIYRINVDKETEISKLFGVNSIPTLIFIPDFNNYKIECGYKEISEIEHLIEKFNKTKENIPKHNENNVKSYPTTRVGNYDLMSENLDVTHFRNGDAIKYIETDSEWARAYANKTPAYCDHPMGRNYGKIYNRYAFDDTRELAPEGWRRPTVDEWNTLIEEIAKKQLEAFYYLKGGYKQRNGEFSKFEDGALFWCSSETEIVDNVLPLYYFVLFENNNYISKLVVKNPYYSELLGKLNARVEANYRFKDKNGVYPSSKGDGMSVRLIKE